MAKSGRDYSIRINKERSSHIDMELLVSSLENSMVDIQYLAPESCIFKTPSILRRHNEDSYNPNAFSIGPFHHGKAQFQATDKIKLKYLRNLLGRSTFPNEQLRKIVQSINEIEPELRNCYAERIEFSKEDFVQILVVDGCFILELLRKDAKLVPIDEDDPIFTMSCMMQFLNHDLILLENQIPWSVLDCLFKMTTMDGNSKPLDQLVIEFFGNTFSSQRPDFGPLQSTNFRRHVSKHMLDLLRNSLILTIDNHHHKLGWQPFPTATKLRAAGIKFRRVVSNSILDVQFRNGILEIPSLLIQETTESIFRNLISFEQCYPNCSPRVTSYVILLDNLIDTRKDVEILCKYEIIDNWLNPEDIVQFFNKLYHDAYVKDYYYVELCGQVNAFCQRRFQRWRAKFIRNYFGTPWGIVAQIVISVLLLFVLINTLDTLFASRTKY
ncbi:hypothetical protein ACFE04_009350 [Oxalis oulophora]